MVQVAEPLTDSLNTTFRLKRDQREWLREKKEREDRSEASIVRQLIEAERKRESAANS